MKRSLPIYGALIVATCATGAVAWFWWHLNEPPTETTEPTGGTDGAD